MLKKRKVVNEFMNELEEDGDWEGSEDDLENTVFAERASKR